MPSGVYLSNDTLQKLNGDLFEQDARGLIGDHFEQQATTQLPDMVRQAQQDEDQRQQAIDQQRRNAMADNFMASVPDALAQHLGNAAPSESPQNSPSVTPPTEPTQTPSEDLNAAPAPVPPAATPIAPSLPAPNAPAPTLPSTATATVHPITVAPATQTTAGLSGGGDLSGRVGARGQQIMSSAATSASWLGDDGVKALQAVLLTEGGLAGARGDQGRSAGPLQFFEGGQLANFAQQHGLSLDAAKSYVEQNPEAAVAWAIGSPDAPGYLGRAIQAGQHAGLKGADLATYAQQHGQVSVSPERAGQNFNALFGGGQTMAGLPLSNTTPRGSADSTATRTSQFGLGLSYDDALAFCGPAAAIALAKRYGNNIPMDQVRQAAAQSGWTPQLGMRGILSEQTLLQNMNVPTHLEQNVDWQHVAQDANGGNPVIVSSARVDDNRPGHYWYVDGSQQQADGSMVYHVGTSGTDLKGGSEWMTSDQMAARMGPISGALYVDNPTSPTPSIAGQVAKPAANATDQQATSSSQSPGLFDKLQQLGPAIGKAIGDLFGGATQAAAPVASAVGQGVSDFALGNSPYSPSSVMQGAETAAGQGIQAVRQTARDVLGPGPMESMQIMQDLSNKYPNMVTRSDGTTLQGPGANLDAMTPEDRQRYTSAIMAVGGLVAPLGAKFDKFGVALEQSPEVASVLKPPQYDQYGVATGFEPPPMTGALAPAADATAPTLGRDVASTLPPGSGPLAAAAAPLESDTTLQGLRNMVEARKPGEAPVPAAELLNLKTEAPTSTAPTTSAPAAASVNAGPVPATPLSLKLAVTGGGGTPPPPGPLVQTALPGIPPPTPGTASLADVFRAYHTGNVVSGLATLTHVAVNSILAPAWSFVTRGAADVAGLNFDRLAGSGIGAGAGLADSGRAIAQAFSDHFSNPDAIFNKTLPGALNSGVAKLFLKAQAIPTSLHAVGQSFAQNAIMKMEVGRLAGEAATDQGLKGQAWSNFVSNTVANPTGAMAQQAEALAKRAALRGDPGTVGQVMGKIASVPYFGNTLFPVVRIASNALSQGIEKSPLGLLGTGLDVARAAIGHEGPYAGPAGFAGNGIVAPLQERLTNNLAGSALTAWLASKALDGSITGDGPGDPGQKAELMAQGWQPNSVYVPGRGYVDYHMFGSLADSFALAGSYGDAVKYSGNKGGTTDDPGTIAESMFKQMGKYLEDATGMRTIGQLYDIFHTQGVGLNQAAKAAAQFGSSLTGGFVPFSALDRNIASATDPYARRAVAEAGDLPSLFGQDLSMGIPGLREQNVPIKQNILGQPEANNQAGLGVFSPRTGTGTPDPVIKAVEDAGVRFPALPKQVSVSSKYAIDLTPQEQQQFQTLRGQLVQQMLGELVADPDFAAAPLASRQKWVQLAFARADKAASQQLVSQVPDSDLVDRAMANQERRAPVAFASP